MKKNTGPKTCSTYKLQSELKVCSIGVMIILHFNRSSETICSLATQMFSNINKHATCVLLFIKNISKIVNHYRYQLFV